MRKTTTSLLQLSFTPQDNGRLHQFSRRYVHTMNTIRFGTANAQFTVSMTYS